MQKVEWCEVVDTKMLAVRWMVDEDGRPQSVTSQRYQEMLQSQVWPEVQNRSRRRQFWFMQDGATSHTTNLNLNFLVEKFRGRVISRRAQEGHFWPPYSPDLNPLDFCVWGSRPSETHPARVHCGTAKGSGRRCRNNDEMLRDAAQNVRKRAKACIEASSGHFKHFLKLC